MWRKEYDKVISEARRKAKHLVRAEVLAVLPKGWTLHLAVGWGLTLYDDEENCLMGTYEDLGDRPLPRGLRHALNMAADYVDTFGYDNSKIVGQKNVWKAPNRKRKAAEQDDGDSG